MLEAHDLAARRGSVRLFTGLSFGIAAGNALQVTGPNGTGKTTLLRMLAGLSAPESGEIRWKGNVAPPFDPLLRAAIAFLGHLPALKDDLTAEENLATLVALTGETHTRDSIREALDAVALTGQRTLPARVLSQGQRRRIGLARLKLSNRPLWILDEPLTSLDAAGIGVLKDLVSQHLQQDGIAIAATHAPLGWDESRTRSLALH